MLPALLLLAVAVAARWKVFGNPVVQIDEQFYLLVGRRMLDGAIPFVDIFDRKPVGLFLIYAAARLPGGSGVLTYQMLALASVWGTALAILSIARRYAGTAAGVAAGIAYVVWLNLAGGEGGQAPVYYNLLVAAAALILSRAILSPRPGGDLRRSGAAAMLLVGLALQIKYSVVFEGLFMGLTLIVHAWRGGRRPSALTADIAIWIGLALLPTAAAAGVYAAIGHFPGWLYANVTSIVDRGHERAATVAGRVRIMMALVVPFAFGVPLRRWLGARPADEAGRAALRFVDGWAASALLGVVLFGTWFNHYALPLFVPFAAAAAPLWRRRWGRAYLVLMILAATIWGQRLLWRHTLTRGTETVLASAVDAAGRFAGCPFVYDGMPAFYDRLGSCLPTTRPFPAHLQSLNESGATGIDQAAEVGRIMARRPERVMTMEPAYDEENPRPRRVLYRALRSDYVELWRYAGGGHEFVVYGRRGTLASR